jgi:hypothetical protein
MVFTSEQHRLVARLLRRKARKAPRQFKQSLNLLASQHMGLARAQDADPRLRPTKTETDGAERATQA